MVNAVVSLATVDILHACQVVHDFAQALVVAGNTPSCVDPIPSFVIEVASGVAAREWERQFGVNVAGGARQWHDLLRRALDRALAHITPPIDPVRCSLDFPNNSPSSAVCSVRPVPYPRHLFEGEMLLPAHVSVAEARAMRREFSAATRSKVKLRRAREALSICNSASNEAAVAALTAAPGTGKELGKGGAGSWVLFPQGLVLSAAVVAFDAVYAYVALVDDVDKSAGEGSKELCVVGRVPRPSAVPDGAWGAPEPAVGVRVADAAAWRRIRKDDGATDADSVHYVRDPSGACVLQLVCYKAHVTSRRVFWLEDLHIARRSNSDAAGRVVDPAASPDTVADFRSLARRAIAQFAPGRCSKVAARFATLLTSTAKIDFKRGKRGASALPRPPAIVGGIVSAEESATLEFKASVAAAGAPHSPLALTGERLRNTICAMANGAGGVLMVGVLDDGRAVGHAAPTGGADASPAALLRTSGFVPAMPKDTIVVRSVPAAHERGELPRDWWRQRAAEPLQPEAGQQLRQQNSAASQTKRMVTMVLVAPGPAPFYCCGRGQLPYMRTFASTVTMSVPMMLQRIAEHIATGEVNEALGGGSGDGPSAPDGSSIPLQMDGDPVGVRATTAPAPDMGKDRVLMDALDNAVQRVGQYDVMDPFGIPSDGDDGGAASRGRRESLPRKPARR